MRIRHRAAAALAGLALSAGAVVGLAAPAQALPPGCKVIDQLTQSGGTLIGLFYRSCPDSGETFYPLQIRQYNAATGAWQVVATGTGDAEYTCAGTTAHQYQSGGTAPLTFACG
jgi:hypothetical protein